MKINELAEHTGLASKTIRYYEDIGLLPEARRSANGYRDYSEADIERIVFIRRCRELQIPLSELKLLVRLQMDKQAPCAEINQTIQNQLEKIRSTIQELEKLEESLNELAQSCRNETVSECQIVRKLSDYDQQSKLIG
ncbi:Mercuric resistance operon regulatory protein [Zhongshania aliphaticivorans]|uniref:Mercuric resistance operon regulatory protein n=1 Tax=Zhongshania aliphaticivorans TaxID=1470434 RepID=A0A5S9NJN9_9GAMM|nr:MerR family transcriptional regulator [Zhongshania aliphaticivorans]CAA0090031.1 Mercuric resistance operon regulatory protein [Zhongshania aliphaticivorans]CAA0097265.1 Mercuric resistance operon regulatory protein [Zhongshania aliphaticivorans]